MEIPLGVGSVSLADKSTSPASDNREGSDLQRGRPYHTQPATNLAWPSSPLPAHARSISSASLQSSTGSGYLTPPIDAFPDDAPYKPAKDDRVSLNMHNPRRRKRKTKCWRSHHGGTERTSEPISFPFEGVRDVQTEYVSANDFDGNHNGVIYQRCLPAPPKISRRKHRLHPRSSKLSPLPPQTALVEHGSWQSHHNSTNIFPGSQHEMARQITSGGPKQIRNNLASISQALTARKYRRWSSVEPGALPVQTYSTATAIRDYRPESEHEHFLGQHSACHGLSKQLAVSTHPKRTLRAGHKVHQRSSVNPKRPHTRRADTPETITLRRASEITALEDATTAAEGASCQDNFAHHAPAQVLKRRVTRLMQQLPSYSVIADSAITYADVHVASPIMTRTLPGVGLGSSTSRLRRTSTVQIRTRSSVHEVIWEDRFSSSSASSASEESPKSNRQLTRTQSEPLERVYFTNPLLDMEWDPERNGSFTRNEICPNSSFVGDESTVGSQTPVVKPPHMLQKLSEWTWDHNSKRDYGNGGALFFIQPHRTDPAVQHNGKPIVNPLSEDQGNTPKELPEEPSARSPSCPFDWRTCLQQASFTNQVDRTTTDHFTGVLVLPTQIDRNRARTARRPTLSVLPESHWRNSANEPRRKEYGQDSTCTRPRTGDDLVAGSAIGSSSRMRRSTRPYHRDSSRRPSDISPNEIGRLCAGHTLQRRTTEPPASPANWVLGLELSSNSPSIKEVPLPGTNDSPRADKPDAIGPMCLDSAKSHEIGSLCQACAAKVPDCGRNPSVDWIG